MLEQYAILQLLQAENECGFDLHFQQDGAPPHWAIEVRHLLDRVFPQHWIDRD
jgi:hypothetical protein